MFGQRMTCNCRLTLLVSPAAGTRGTSLPWLPAAAATRVGRTRGPTSTTCWPPARCWPPPSSCCEPLPHHAPPRSPYQHHAPPAPPTSARSSLASPHPPLPLPAPGVASHHHAPLSPYQRHIPPPPLPLPAPGVASHRHTPRSPYQRQE